MTVLAELDSARLRETLALAEQAIGLSDPNPRVGCIVGDSAGRVFGRGFTQQAGGPHAEVMAMRDARAAGHDLRGATAWVTLEPCAHHGRTPPCADALVQAGLARVVVAIGDPFPGVAGSGIARLRDAGIRVDLAGVDSDVGLAARELNIGFFSRIERRRPWVRLKVAVSLDGRTALADGRSQWITGAAARTDVHAWRRRAGAIVTGVGTVAADDPQLDVRLVPTAVQPLRVVLDPSLRIARQARLLQPPGRVLLAHRADLDHPPAAAAFGSAAGLLPLRARDDGLDLSQLLGALAEREVNELHIEAGPRLNGAWIRSGLVDELLVYIGAKLVGPGLPLAALNDLPDLAAAPTFQHIDAAVLADTLRWRLRPHLSNGLTAAASDAGNGD